MAALERPRRANAGRKIGTLLDQEVDGDEFYKNAYGGFDEVSEDEEYLTEESEGDIVDSDFDLSENDAGPEQDDEDDSKERAKRKKWMPPVGRRKDKENEAAPKPSKPKSKPKVQPSLPESDLFAPRSLRRSTVETSEDHKRRRIEEERRRKRFSRRSSVPDRKLTQAELLAEAKRTEVENVASLEAYVQLEAEKNMVKEKKDVVQGPVIRYLSVSMPLIVEDGVPADKDGGPQPSQPPQPQKPAEKYCRNFLVFTDTKAFPHAYFPADKPARPKKLFCSITGLVAKYVDPLTGTPYASPQAFKIIRNRYVVEGEQKCEKRLLQLSSWLEEKKRKRLESRS